MRRPCNSRGALPKPAFQSLILQAAGSAHALAIGTVHRRPILKLNHQEAEGCFARRYSFQRLGRNGASVFGDRTIASAILDRLLHHAGTLNIRGNSYRLKEKLKAGLLRPHDGGARPGGEI